MGFDEKVCLLVYFLNGRIDNTAAKIRHSLISISYLETIPEVVRSPITDILKDSARWYADVNREMSHACDFFNKG